MDFKNEIRGMLLEKVEAEYRDFIESLKTLPAERIIERSYEKVMKEDLLLCMEDDFLSERQIKALLKQKNPLQECFDEWQKSDASYMAERESVIEQFKAADQMAWVGAMNNIRSRATEIVNAEVIYR